MTRPGFQEVVHSAFDIERIAGPLCAVGGWTRTALADAPREQWAAWHVPPACTRIEQCLLTAPVMIEARCASSSSTVSRRA